MNLFRVLEISGSALLAERMRAEIISANLANAETTRTDSGGPYQRMHVVFGARRSCADGVWHDAGLVRGHARRRCPRGRPGGRSNARGPAIRARASRRRRSKAMWPIPAINPAEEMINLMGAARAYEINASAIASTKNMIQTAIRF